MKLNSKNNDLTVLMATYEGEEFISEQIRSLVDQDLDRVDLIVSDDSKSSYTCDAIRKETRILPNFNVHYLSGPQNGFAENFSNLVLNWTPKTEYISFSDQDDIWIDDKTKRSIEWLSQQPRHVPALYCGRTRMVDENGLDTGRLSPLFPHEPAFENALVQSIAGGNTMTMNLAAFKLIKRSLFYGIPVSHDWWADIMVSGAGGSVRYDPKPLTLYRQHDRNLVGENQSLFAVAKRIQLVMNGTWRNWQNQHIKLLDDNLPELTPEAEASYNALKKMRRLSSLELLQFFRQSGVWRQTRGGNASLYLAALIRRF